jgi:hypothetical protein
MDVPNFLIVMYVPVSVVCVFFVCKCVLLPPGVNQILYHISHNISYVVIFVGVIGKVIHRKWEAAKPIDVYMIRCRLNPILFDSALGCEFCWWEYFMLRLKN